MSEQNLPLNWEGHSICSKRCKDRGSRGGGRGQSMTITIPSTRVPDIPLLSTTPSSFFMINVLSHSLVCERDVVSCSSLLGPGALVPTWLRQGAIWYRKIEGLKAVNGLGWYLCSCSPGQSTCLPSPPCMAQKRPPLQP